jgi:uncharacterized protein YraI
VPAKGPFVIAVYTLGMALANRHFRSNCRPHAARRHRLEQFVSALARALREQPAHRPVFSREGTRKRSKTMKLLLSAMAGALALMGGTALAETPVSATADLNVRAGPGPQYPVIGVLAAGQSATLSGCLQGSKWCTIAEAGGQGWIYSDYVTADFGGRTVVLTERPPDAGIAVVQPPADVEDSPAYTGAIEPGEADGTFPAPPAEVRTYVTTHRLEPVYLDGEVVSGAVLPDTVDLQEIPDYDYRYVYVNGQPAVVDPTTRRVVYVVR